MRAKLTRWFSIIMLVVSLVSTGCSLPDEYGSRRGNNSEAKRKLVVATSIYRPFVYLDEKTNQLIGYDIDLANALAKEMGATLEVKVLQFTSLVPALQNNQADIAIAAMYITKDRKEQIDFSRPYVTTDMVLVVRNNDLSIQNIRDLNGKMVGVKTGATSEKVAQSLKEKGIQIIIKSYRESSEYLEDLEKGRLDAVINDRLHQNEYDKHHDSMDIIGEPLMTADLGVAIKKGDKKMLDFINKTIDNMDKSGFSTTLQHKWLDKGN
ncbi:transporter substrate-binding domain-containing protein [Sporomusa malonica]|uniref:Polar amino acid transport system substrate-binding protein n=1 Tax=Sporomusa malonica TaxID=112901 RepID=A0A1W2E877_9FIRM|nr:transporter substrate-binding domain-containing protein [Sporomusa malonica]SMD05268.1 polar amino acid transport system substrate-binding protein [Sporomusa malonica]